MNENFHQEKCRVEEDHQNETTKMEAKLEELEEKFKKENEVIANIADNLWLLFNAHRIGTCATKRLVQAVHSFFFHFFVLRHFYSFF